ncbi:hypothetical protein H1R20_g15048, partial [Candolleomyces eurysporus]
MANISYFSNANKFSITNSSLTFVSNSKVDVIQEDLKTFLLDHLKPSHIADHKFHLEGEKQEVLRRVTCTPGTRITILASIIKWANDTSSENTKYETRIVRTIVYHLALMCKAFADALRRSGKFDTVHHGVRAQLEHLLVGPWLESESTRGDSSASRRYIIVIDALDEVHQQGGSAFLRDLLDVINERRLPGLKFFVTSRADPDLATRVESFRRKKIYRLQDVEKVEVEADITMYLEASLPHFKDRDEMGKLVAFAGGLFIGAATLVRYLTHHTRKEQRSLLRKLFSDSATLRTSSNATRLLDALYVQILSDAFGHFEDDVVVDRLRILHTFLCTPERTTSSTVASLLISEDPDETDSAFSSTEVADDVLSRLYAVLYTDDRDHVLSYHKSFSDFIFDWHRSKEYYCDRTALHRYLSESCFHVMATGLKFNIANIPSSFLFDSNNPALPSEVKRNIPSTLSYACRNWSHHLSATASTTEDPLVVTLLDFLDLRVLFWIEAMNLLGCRGLCDPMLQTTRKWIAKDDPEVARQLTEAASFAIYFSGSPASLSTPHLYISALATWPQDDNPFKKWRTHFPRIPGFTNASRSGLLLMVLAVDSCVNAIAFSNEGTRIVSGLWNNSVMVWDASTGDVQRVLEGHTKRITSVAFSSDGTRIISGSHDNSVRIWDASTGEVQHVLEGHTNGVTSVAFSSDGTRIVSGSYDQSVKVWDASTGEVQNMMEGHTDGVTSAVFSSDGTRVVSGAYDETVRVWDIVTGEVQNVLEGHTAGISSVAFSRDGTRIASGSYDNSSHSQAMERGLPLVRMTTR